MKKTWIEKYNQPREKTIKILDKDFTDMKAGEKMLIATPQIINKYVNQIPSSYCLLMRLTKSRKIFCWYTSEKKGNRHERK